tara:strand:- start:3663 stop:4031 length:369 start_codon:yes stop_codon:yes gene_type:complete
MLKAPAWAKNAVPTVRGWQNPKTGELLLARKHSVRQVEEWHSSNKVVVEAAPKSAPAPIVEADPVIVEAAPTAEPLIEADPVDHDHTNMTKAQLVEHAASVHGLELDASMTKAQMIEAIETN